MKEKFSIGETAEMIGIPVETLRYYSNIGLVTPEYVDKNNGYRYYSFNNIHFIDRIKYLRSFDVPLKDINAAMKDGNPEKLIPALQKTYCEMGQKLQSMAKKAEALYEYIEYFEYPKKHAVLKYPYIKWFPERYAIGTYCKNESVSLVETRLYRIKGDKVMRHLHCQRQLGYVFDYRSFLKGEFVPSQHYILLSEKPDYIPEKYKDNFIVFPEGEYLCLMSKIRSSSWNASTVSHMFDINGEDTLIIANEYENSLIEYSQCPYEIQMLLK